LLFAPWMRLTLLSVQHLSCFVAVQYSKGFIAVQHYFALQHK